MMQLASCQLKFWKPQKFSLENFMNIRAKWSDVSNSYQGGVCLLVVFLKHIYLRFENGIYFPGLFHLPRVHRNGRSEDNSGIRGNVSAGFTGFGLAFFVILLNSATPPLWLTFHLEYITDSLLLMNTHFVYFSSNLILNIHFIASHKIS